MWYKDDIFYQIYPFGFCGAPDENDGRLVNRISKITDWIPHLKEIGVGAVYLCPIFESDAHGYDTRDYGKIDSRLGSNDDFAAVCRALHEADIRVVLDGVFNHVGRGFWAFQDVREKRQNSAYKDWFYIDFNGNSYDNDGFWYEGWEGHFNLVKLNLHNPRVVDYLFSCIRKWVDEFEIDGLRLDVAYLLEPDFLRQLRSYCRSLKPDFFLLGEIIHGDYNRLVNSEMLDSCTNYECYKGIFSSFNSGNMFEIAYSLNRQFGLDQWTLYKGMHLFNFADNHDVDRLASSLMEPGQLQAAYGLLMGMPGIPCLYYGSEWGARGKKEAGTDTALRPCFQEPQQNEMTRWISRLAQIRRDNPALRYGDYRQIYLTNHQFLFIREYQGNKILVAINAEAAEHQAETGVRGEVRDLLTGQQQSWDGFIQLPAFSAGFYSLI